jgi:hypothetical protein
MFGMAGYMVVRLIAVDAAGLTPAVIAMFPPARHTADPSLQPHRATVQLAVWPPS